MLATAPSSSMSLPVKQSKTKTMKTQFVVRRLIETKLCEEQSTYTVQRVIKKGNPFHISEAARA